MFSRGRRGANAVYLALLGLLGGSAWAALRLGESRVVELFAANLATEALGLIVTLVLVHRYLERQERAVRLRGSLGAVRRSGRALATMVDVWGELVKATLERAPAPMPTDLRELLAPDLTEALIHLDPRRQAVAEAGRRLGAARDTLRGIIATYGSTLDPVYLGAIDDLTDDPFLALLADIASDPGGAPDRLRSSLRSARSARLAHFDRLLLAVQDHNQIARDAARLRNPRTAPRGDGYSAALPLDLDLRVHTDVAPEWWYVAPRPGALRTVRNRDAAVPKADGSGTAVALPAAVNSANGSDLRISSDAVRGFPLDVASQRI